MKIIRTKLVRLTGCKYIATPWAIFAAPKAIILDNDLNHEAIHSAQWKELFYIGFIMWYVIEWLIRLPKGNAYRSISFEREAYTNENDMEYLSNRRHFAFIKYLWS